MLSRALRPQEYMKGLSGMIGCVPYDTGRRRDPSRVELQRRLHVHVFKLEIEAVPSSSWFLLTRTSAAMYFSRNSPYHKLEPPEHLLVG